MFGSFSGLTINADKTKIIWIGKKSYSSEKLDTDQTLKWGATSFDLLGINFSVNLEEMTKLNYTPVIASIKKNDLYLDPKTFDPNWQDNNHKNTSLIKIKSLISLPPIPRGGCGKNLRKCLLQIYLGQ